MNEASDSKFVARKWNIINDQSNASYDVGNEIIYNTKVFKSNFCDYNDAYILVRPNITIIRHQVTKVEFKNCAPFTKCITKIDGTTIDDAEDLDLVMQMQNLIEYCSNYSKATGILWFYSKDQATNFNADIANDNSFKSFKYKAKLLRNTVANVANRILRNETIAVPLRHLGNFWRSLEMPLINCKVELKPKWTKYYVLSAADADNNDANFNNIIFTIKDTQLFVSVVTLSAKDNQKFLAKDLKDQFIRMNIKQKARIKVGRMNIDVSSNQILLELTDYLF